jgi:hypothetical protein
MFIVQGPWAALVMAKLMDGFQRMFHTTLPCYSTVAS